MYIVIELISIVSFYIQHYVGVNNDTIAEIRELIEETTTSTVIIGLDDYIYYNVYLWNKIKDQTFFITNQLMMSKLNISYISTGTATRNGVLRNNGMRIELYKPKVEEIE